MTNLYFVRHAEPNFNNHSDKLRELTAKGTKDTKLVTDYLRDKNIDVVLSSPYKRSFDTVLDFASKYGFEIEKIYDFRERKIDSIWIEDFITFSKKQWADFNYKLSDGEALGDVQSRNISALKAVLAKYPDKNIVVGSHGTALSTIINYYDNSFGYEDFEKIKKLMPWVVSFQFDGNELIKIEKINLFER